MADGGCINTHMARSLEHHPYLIYISIFPQYGPIYTESSYWILVCPSVRQCGGRQRLWSEQLSYHFELNWLGGKERGAVIVQVQ